MYACSPTSPPAGPRKKKKVAQARKRPDKPAAPRPAASFFRPAPRQGLANAIVYNDTSIISYNMYYLLFLHNYSLASTPKVTNHKNKSNILLHCPWLAYSSSNDSNDSGQEKRKGKVNSTIAVKHIFPFNIRLQQARPGHWQGDGIPTGDRRRDRLAKK